MKQIALMIALAFALLMGCQTDDSIGPSTDLQLSSTSAMTVAPEANTYLMPDQARNGEPVERKFKVRGSGTFTFGPPSCDPPAVADAIVEGTGNATHLGAFTIELSYCIDAAQNPVTLPSGIQTAANGDQLFTQMVYTDVDPELGLYQDYIYDGGTGRFEYAEGFVRLYTEIDLVNLTYSNHGEGWLTY